MFLEDGNAAHFAALNDENRQYLRFTGTRLIGLDVAFSGIVPITACSADPGSSGSIQFSSHADLNTTFRLLYRTCYVGGATPVISLDRYQCFFGGAGSDPTTDTLAMGSADYDAYSSADCSGTPTPSSVDFFLSALAAKEWVADYEDPGGGFPPTVRLTLLISTSNTSLGGLFVFNSQRAGRGVSVAPGTWLAPALDTGSPFGYDPGIAYDFSSATCTITPVFL